MATIRLPTPLFYTLEDLASEWGCHPDRLRSFAASGLLEVRTTEMGGTSVPAIAVEEKARFEALVSPSQAQERAINGRERRSLLNLIGVLAYVAYVRDVARPYALTRTIQEDAARLGLTLEIGDDTIADKLKDSFELMRQCGCGLFDPSPE